MIDTIIGDRFQRIDFIGQGNCGRVFLALDLEDSSYIALKVDTSDLKSLLENEKNILTTLHNCSGVPKLISYGETPDYNYLALQLLGPCLEDKFIECQRKFPFMDFINYSRQLISIIETIHNYGVIHRDIKPRQIVLGPANNKTQVYLIDFGISMKYKESNHIEYSENNSFIGTCNYCSINTHKGIQQSRRDDLETFCYVLAYFYTGTLPWFKDKTTDAEIANMKIGTSGKDLFGSAAKDLVDIFKYVKSLKFDDEPDYDYVKDKLNQLKHKFTVESRIYRQYTTMPVSKPKKIKKKFTFIEDTEEIILNLDNTVVSKGPEINRAILRKC